MTRSTGLEKSLLHVMLTIVWIAQAPPPGFHGRIEHPGDQALIPELQLIKDEETVSIASRHEQPNSKTPSSVYVLTDEDFQHSGATDIPTLRHNSTFHTPNFTLRR